MLNSIINVDLHIHSKASSYKEEPGFVKDSSINELDVLFKVMDIKNINLFSITDHNRFDVDLYDKALEIIEKTENYPNVMGLVSGVEFDVTLEKGMGPCHIITIFDTKERKDRERIQYCINTDKLLSPQDSYTKERYEALLKNIGLNTLLIVHQKHSLDRLDKSHKSLSGSVADPYRIIEIGYISALEYQKSAIEGILKNNLKIIDRQIPLFTGSDCHQWKFYPKHHEAAKFEIKNFTTMKCLPTFKGLLLSLTSPNTRLNKMKTVKKESFLDSFKIGENEIPLDYGINAIVGENGSGKSTIVKLLSGATIPAYVKKIGNNSEFTLNKKFDESKTLMVAQSEIVQKFNGDKLFENSLYKEVDHTEFESAYKEYSKSIKKVVEYNIDVNDLFKSLEDTKVTIDPEKEIDTYYVSIDSSNLKQEENEAISDRKDSLNKILLSVKKEVENEFYDEQQKSSLNKVYEILLYLYTDISLKYYTASCKNNIKNILINKSDDYKVSIAALQNSADGIINEYKESKIKVISILVSYLKKKNQKITKPSSVKVISNKADNFSNGYVFRRIAKYSESNVESDFMKKMFVGDYQSIEKLLEIKTKEEFKNAVLQCSNINKIDEKLELNTQKFLDEMMTCNEFILEAGSDVKQGRTLGQISLTYYKYHLNTDNNKDVICIDQPEDNLSNNLINKELIKYLNALRKDRQIIIVTHNPLLIVNLDVDNVIKVELINGKLNCVAGCLEDENSKILNYVANSMDGGRESIERRYKLYE
ncbi:MAG: ATP-binding cassette domain-containing protein [Erysipelotrichaceae bacterium]